MSRKKLHKTGAWLSILCTVHCLAMPFVVTAMPFLGETVVDETAEHFLVVGSWFLAAYLLWKDYRQHKNLLPFAILLLGVLIGAIGMFSVPHELETPFIISGAIAMALAYYINWQKAHASCNHAF